MSEKGERDLCFWAQKSEKRGFEVGTVDKISGWEGKYARGQSAKVWNEREGIEFTVDLYRQRRSLGV